MRFLWEFCELEKDRTEKVFLQFLLLRHYSSIIHGAAEAASDAMERESARKNEKFLMVVSEHRHS